MSLACPQDPTTKPAGGSDASVQGTNDDAQISKLSCVKLGYFQDDFLRYFVRRPARRSPLINRGYYSRAAALRRLLTQFLAARLPEQLPGTAPLPPKQVLCLGCGFETTWFQLQSEGIAPPLWFEVDFRDVTARKAAIIGSTPALHHLLGVPAAEAVKPEEGTVRAPGYALLAGDLRDLPALAAQLTAAGLRPDAPTYVLAECVLVYMPPAASAALVSWLGGFLSCAALVIYEQIKPDDAFGRQMLINLQSRGCPLVGLPATPDLAAHRARLAAGGWQRVAALDMDTIYQHHLDPADKRRIERLEIFDEFEEWHMIQEHYCIAYGINDSTGLFDSFGFHQSTATLPSAAAALALPGRRPA